MSICVIYGPVASGKLTTAQEFSKQTGYQLFHNHLIQDVLVSIIPYTREDLREERAKLSCRIRKDILRTLLRSGIDTVMTMNYGGTGGLDMMRFIVDTAKEYNQPVYITRLMPPRETLERRVTSESRKSYKKADTLEILNRLLDSGDYGYEKFSDFEHLEIDNSDVAVEDVVRRIREYYSIAEAK